MGSSTPRAFPMDVEDRGDGIEQASRTFDFVCLAFPNGYHTSQNTFDEQIMEEVKKQVQIAMVMSAGGGGVQGTTQLPVPQFGPPNDLQPRETDNVDAKAPVDLLVQGMRVPRSWLLCPNLLVKLEWLYVAEQTIGAMSDSAAQWYERTLSCAKEAYTRYQLASPLERLSVAPRMAPELLEPKWVRLDGKVMSLILNAMPKAVKEDAVTHRVSSVAMVLYRLHVLYSPGGIAERTAILKHLEGVSAGDAVVDVIAALRKWKRQLTRSQEMHPEMSFRLSLARNELQLQSRPTNESVMKFYDHLLAEMQQALPTKWAMKGSSGEAPKIKAIGAGTGEVDSVFLLDGGSEGCGYDYCDSEFQTFMKEVNTMLQRMTRLNRLEVVKPVAPRLRRWMDSWALLDSDQTVQVQLADGQSVALQQNRAGTLMPVKDSVLERGDGLTTIVPLGTLVQELNCTVSWDKRGLRVRHPEHGELVMHVSGSCPFIGETRALELIGEIEARKLEQLKANTLETQMRVLGIEAETTFETKLTEYRRTGKRADGLGALMAKDSLFGELTESQRCELVQDIDLSDAAGVWYLKALPIKRSLRRRLLGSQWIVNLCAGSGDRSDFKALEEEGLALLELDIKKSKAFNLRGPSHAYRALLWAAMRGQLEGLMGSPPRSEGDGELVKKQFLLWWLARVASDELELRRPYFVMTMPVNSALWTSSVWAQARELAMKFRWTTSGMTRCVTNLPTNLGNVPWERRGPEGQLEWKSWRDGPNMFVKGTHRITNGLIPPGDSHPVLSGAPGPEMVEANKLDDSVDMDGVFEVEVEEAVPPVGDLDREEMDRLNEQYNELVSTCKSRQMDWKFSGYILIGLLSFAMEGCVNGSWNGAQTPQQNGRAESTVKFVKAEARLLMTTAKLPKQTWPLAMMYATHKQRHLALGRTEELPTFGTPVYVRTKVYGRAGKYDVDNKWAPGAYVGPSEDVQHGHVVRFPDGTFVTSLHLKKALVNADELVDLEPREIEVPLPERRVRGKTRLAKLFGVHPLTVEEEQAENEAKKLFQLNDWSVEAVLRLYDYLKAIQGHRLAGRAASSQGSSWYTGTFVHGGVAGLRSSTTRLKWCTRYLVEAAKKINGHSEFTALGLMENMDIGYHKDSHNEVDSWNVVTLLHAPECGGDIWVEHEELDPRFAEWKQVARKTWKKGFAHRLEVGQPFKFHPRRWHEVQPWTGRRVILVTYTPRINKLHYMDRDVLEFMGFEGEHLIHNNGVQNSNAIHNNGVQTSDVIHNNGVQNSDVIHNNGVQNSDVIHNNGVQNSDVIHNNGVQNSDVIHNNGVQNSDVIHNNGGVQGGDCENNHIELHLLRSPEGSNKELLDDVLLAMAEDQDQLLEDLQERSDRLRWMIEEEEILAEERRRAGQQISDDVDHVRAYLDDMIEEVSKLKAASSSRDVEACLRALNGVEEPDYEKLLSELEGDLEVVHTVPLNQVRAALDNWVEALEKEVKQLLDGTLRPIPLTKARELERQGLLRLVPSKGVFTLKPPLVKGKKVRRKFRLVLCGNYVERDDDTFDLYAGGVSADTVRLCLSYACHRRWRGGTSDVTGAFLLAEWPQHLARYAIFPPRILVEAGFASAEDAWEVIRPLYGLRGSPSIWAKHRTDRLREAKIPYKGRTIVLVQSTADPELWMAYDEDSTLRATGGLLALLITYVDDLFYLAERSLVEALHEWVQKEWPCSALEWADGEQGTRYPGMEIKQTEDCSFELSQEGYIRELLRSYGLEEAVDTKLPCPREWLADDGSEEENFHS
ncbi:PMT4 [Symbiodinium sp. CCMP2592]|nr:PMT4 [Symbiodinium sp. CCMP2592]